MFWFVLFEIFVIATCIFVAKKMVEKRNGLTRFIQVSTEDDQEIKNMKNIVRQIIIEGRLEILDEYDGYEIDVKVKERCIVDIVIRTQATKIEYNSTNGWKIESIAYTEKGAIAYIAFILWAIILGIQIMGVVVMFIIWVRSMIM